MRPRLELAAALAGILVSAAADAQVIGTFRWQTQPFCNLVTLTVVQHGGVYQLSGSDDLCGAGVAPISGTAVPTGANVAMGFAVALPTGRTAHISATVTLATVSGVWTDSDGSTGTFAFTSASTGGPARPAPFAAAAITVNQFSPAVYGGTGAAATVARSDHNHDIRYASRTTTVRVSGTAMQLSGVAVAGTFNGCASNSTDTSPGTVSIPLPLGATLNSVVASVYDSIAATNYSVTLVRETVGTVGLASSTILGTAAGGAVAGSTVSHDISPPAGTVVGANDAFYFRFSAIPAFSNGLCSVQYTYTAPPAS